MVWYAAFETAINIRSGSMELIDDPVLAAM
jgi:hypothetical protein